MGSLRVIVEIGRTQMALHCRHGLNKIFIILCYIKLMMFKHCKVLMKNGLVGVS